jgi:uncharacterized membrane protein HdeD (DUF308 family)
MSETMSDNLKELAEKNKPWRRDLPWWIVAVQGVVLVIIGIIALTDANALTGLLLYVIGGYMLLNSAIAIFAVIRGASSAPVRMIQAGIGLQAGAVVLVQLILPITPQGGAAVSLAMGLTLTGLVGIIALFMGRAEGSSFPWAGLVREAISLVLGILLFITLFSPTAIASLLTVIGVLGLAGGAALLVLAFLRFRGASQTVAAE